MGCAQRPNYAESIKFQFYEGGFEMRIPWAIVSVLLVLWLLGVGFHVAGGLIHLLLVVAYVVFIVDLLTGTRSAA